MAAVDTSSAQEGFLLVEAVAEWSGLWSGALAKQSVSDSFSAPQAFSWAHWLMLTHYANAEEGRWGGELPEGDLRRPCGRAATSPTRASADGIRQLPFSPTGSEETRQ
ncbi:hypothetical protein [Burkholderia cepacia]|uniref:hypothetical protein n=1 Tax=Burkholderia cepacia TaxID=292 RepID=UPI0012D9A8B6|nr:hypothetical protein [Burkholderia cepacia]